MSPEALDYRASVDDVQDLDPEHGVNSLESYDLRDP